jgi:hypothetical protein
MAGVMDIAVARERFIHPGELSLWAHLERGEERRGEERRGGGEGRGGGKEGRRERSDEKRKRR